MAQPTGPDARWRPDPTEQALLRSRAGTCYASAARRSARALTAAYDRALAPVGLRVGQFSLLHTTALHAPVSVAELAEAMGMDRTTLTANLKPLVRDGLVLIERAERDQRVRRVSVSVRGGELLRRAVPLWEGAQEEFAASFGPERARALRTELASTAQASAAPA